MAKRIALRGLAFVVLGLGAPLALAHPTFFAKNYRSCLGCHASPEGGGLLTSYGQSVAMAESFFVKSQAEMGEESPELKIFADRVRLGLHARVMAVKPEGAELSVFPMQADTFADWAVNDQHRVHMTLGYNGVRGTVREGLTDYLALRRLYYAYRTETGFDLELGRDYAPAPLLVDDHTAYTRGETRHGVDDAVTLVRGYWGREDYDFSAFLIGPGFHEADENREYGIGGRVEYQPRRELSFGAYSLSASSSALSRWHGSLFGRGALAERYGLLWEYSHVRRSFQRDGSFGENIVAFRPFVLMGPALVSFPVETLSIQAPFEDRRTKLGPRVDLRAFGHVSLIGIYQREIQKAGARNAWSLQLFGYF